MNVTVFGKTYRPGGKGAKDGAGRAEPRPGSPKQEVEGWKANPPLPKARLSERKAAFVIMGGFEGIPRPIESQAKAWAFHGKPAGMRV
jgi:hypothetical protein